MINGGSVDEANAVREVLKHFGLEGPCSTDLPSQGEGIWMVLVEASPGLFMSGFIGAAGVDAWRGLRQLLEQLRIARNEKVDSHGQLYVRPEVVTTEEWEENGRKGPLPGFPKPGTDEGVLVDTLMSDDDLQSLIDRHLPGRGTFFERRRTEHAAYLATDLAEGLNRAELLDRMEGLLSLTKEAGYSWTTTHGALIYATIARSTRTYEGICLLLRAGLAVQAAMLSRSLFEDVLVTHWLILHAADHEWFSARFLRHREAVALHQRTLEKEEDMNMGVRPISVPNDIEDRAEALRKEFLKQATRDWWASRKENGEGKDFSIPEIVKQLEEAAANHVMFHPRFAGGDTAVLRKTDRVVNKWLSQCLHHTTIGLPFAPTSEGKTEIPEDPMIVVSFRAAWLYSQQVYLLQEIERRELRGIEAIWMYCMAAFVRISHGRAGEMKVKREWNELWGHGESLERAAEAQYERIWPQRWWRRLWRRMRRGSLRGPRLNEPL
jgi:hypothetical protein